MKNVKLPVRASNFSINWVSVSFSKQTTYRNQLPEALGRNK